jgi:hypothetical protein
MFLFKKKRELKNIEKRLKSLEEVPPVIYYEKNKHCCNIPKKKELICGERS